MATENNTTTDPRYGAMNAAEKALRELHALSDVLLHVDAQELNRETTSTLGEMLDGIAKRLQGSVDVLFRDSETVAP